jgi:hypothetical protein
MVLTLNSDYFVKQYYQLIFVMVKCGVLFEVRTGFVVSNSQIAVVVVAAVVLVVVAK